MFPSGPPISGLQQKPANLLQDPLERLIDHVRTDWRSLLQRWQASPEGRQVIQWVDTRVAQGAAVFPADVFRAFRLTPCAATRVLILGQDPYHAPNQAEGLAFSVPPGQPLPPSLRNVFKELTREFPDMPAPVCGHLGAWARGGVLLLNTSLTVEQGRPGSHARQGWEILTDQVIAALATDPSPKVFMLWGAHAQSKAGVVEAHAGGGRHLILRCNHPSPLSALRGPHPFMGCGHFAAAAEFLGSQPGHAPWQWPVV